MIASPPDAPASPKSKRCPPAYLFALGRQDMPAEFSSRGVVYRFHKLFKHDFFAATGLYQASDAGMPAPDASLPPAGDLAVLKIQRTYPFFGFPLKWLGRMVANHEIRIYEALQGIEGVPGFLGKVGSTGFAHAFIPGEDLHAKLPLTPLFFEQLEKLFSDLHDRRVAYVDANKRENILHGNDGRPWLIDFQISYELKRNWRGHFLARWLFRRFVRGDVYHFYKHKTRLLPDACSAEDFDKARRRGILHELHRWITRPMIVIRRKFLSRYDLANTR